jgi:hypothetical protein
MCAGNAEPARLFPCCKDPVPVWSRGDENRAEGRILQLRLSQCGHNGKEMVIGGPPWKGAARGGAELATPLLSHRRPHQAAAPDWTAASADPKSRSVLEADSRARFPPAPLPKVAGSRTRVC